MGEITQECKDGYDKFSFSPFRDMTGANLPLLSIPLWQNKDHSELERFAGMIEQVFNVSINNIQPSDDTDLSNVTGCIKNGGILTLYLYPIST